jgi:hypothetical protein
MRDLVRLIVWMVADLFRSRTVLEVEIWMLRQQINVQRRNAPKKQTFSSIDRLIFVCLYRLGVRDALAIVRGVETLRRLVTVLRTRLNFQGRREDRELDLPEWSADVV